VDKWISPFSRFPKLYFCTSLIKKQAALRLSGHFGYLLDFGVVSLFLQVSDLWQN
jgi:hypothetical protein